MYYDEVVEVLDLRTLYHNGLAHVHELGFCSADDEASLETADVSRSIVDDVSLDYSHEQSLLEL